MKLVTRAGFAKITGVSRKTATMAVKRGDVDTMFEGRDLMVDVTGKRTVQYINGLADKGVSSPGLQKAISNPKTAQKEPLGQEALPDIDLEAVSEAARGNLEFLSATSVKRLKEIEQVLTIKQKREADRMELIRREMVARVFAKIYAVDVNEFRTLGANLSPIIASITGTDSPEIILKIEKAVEDSVFKVLGHVKRIIHDFLKDIGAEEL